MTVYRATYEIDGYRFYRAFAADDQEHAQEQAEDATEEMETLVEVIDTGMEA